MPQQFQTGFPTNANNF
jgi:hypothetical protein